MLNATTEVCLDQLCKLLRMVSVPVLKDDLNIQCSLLLLLFILCNLLGGNFLNLSENNRLVLFLLDDAIESELWRFYSICNI